MPLHHPVRQLFDKLQGDETPLPSCAMINSTILFQAKRAATYKTTLLFVSDIILQIVLQQLSAAVSADAFRYGSAISFDKGDETPLSSCTVISSTILFQAKPAAI
jgi:hypothetical protein